MAIAPGVLIHPVRLRIMAELSGRPHTTRELAVALPDVPQATLYRHVGILVDAGAIEVVAERTVNGAVERTYEVVAGAGRLAPGDLQGLSADELTVFFTTFAAALLDTFSVALQQSDPATLLTSGLSCSRAVVHLSDDERDEFASELTELVTRMLTIEPRADRRAYTLASVVIPQGGTS